MFDGLTPKKFTRGDTPTAPSAREIAATVRLSGKHQIAENKLAVLRSKRETFRQRMAEIRDNALTGEGRKLIDMNKVAAEEQTNEAAVVTCRHELVELRAERAERVVDALKPLRTDAARRARAAVVDLKAAISTINAANDEIRKASGDAPTIWADLDQIERALRGVI